VCVVNVEGEWSIWDRQAVSRESLVLIGTPAVEKSNRLERTETKNATNQNLFFLLVPQCSL